MKKTNRRAKPAARKPDVTKPQIIKPDSAKPVTPATTVEPISGARGAWPMVAAVAVLVAGLGIFLWSPRTRKPAASAAAASPSSTGADSLLQQMAQEQKPVEGDLTGPVATSQQLEKQYTIIAENQAEVNQLRAQAAAALAAKDSRTAQKVVALGQPQVQLLEARLAALQKDLTAARRVRPDDPVVQWLTGELLVTVGGEPESILPYLKQAQTAKIDQPHLYASLATVEFDLNQFQQSYETASQAVEKAPRDQSAWEIYARAGFAVERFVDVLVKLDRTFAGNAPEWVAPIRRTAMQLQKSWRAEQAARLQDTKKGDLPRVKLTIEHRKFADGTQSAASAGRGEVVLELFEDQAPATVSNFIHLLETGFYDGTSFYWAEAGHLVVAGDPNTKNDNPADDGLGGPGYVIPDEFALPNARAHFRGTISTVQNGPGKAGSQFFITLVAAPEFDGNSTAFGRVVQGQDVLDRVTQGRTNRNVGQFGKIIPGDLIVHAEVVRKRPHAYAVTKRAPGVKPQNP